MFFDETLRANPFLNKCCPPSYLLVSGRIYLKQHGTISDCSVLALLASMTLLIRYPHAVLVNEENYYHANINSVCDL